MEEALGPVEPDSVVGPSPRNLRGKRALLGSCPWGPLNPLQLFPYNPLRRWKQDPLPNRVNLSWEWSLPRRHLQLTVLPCLPQS